MRSIKEIIMSRDGMSEIEVDELIEDAKEDLQDRIAGNGDDPYEICADWFGLEPDYVFELMDFI